MSQQPQSMSNAALMAISVELKNDLQLSALKLIQIEMSCARFKVIGIRPMAPVLKQVHLKASEHEMLSFSVRKEIIKNDNSLVVILLSKVVENEFLETL